MISEEKIGVKLSKLDARVSNIEEIQKEIKRVLDSLSGDREIIGDLRAEVVSLREVVYNLRDHQNSQLRDIKAEVIVGNKEQKRDLKDVVEAANDVISVIETKKIVQVKEDSIWKAIKRLVGIRK